MLVLSLAAAGILSQNILALTLTNEGKSTTVIHQPATKSPYSELAADEIRTYLKKISGAETNSEMAETVPVIQLVNLSDSSNLIPAEMAEKLKNAKRNEAFYIKTAGKTIYIAGKTPLGMLFGTYEFLQKYLGVRWFYPGTTGETYPAMKTIKLDGIDDFQDPVMNQVGYWAYSNTENRKVPWERPDSAVWLLRNKIRPGYMGFVKDPRIRKIMIPPAKSGGGGGHLTFEFAVPANIYYDKHPEYYPLVDGVRVRPTGHGRGQVRAQLCVSNPDVKKLVYEYILKYTQENPEQVFPMGAADAPNMWCQCPECKKMGTGADGKFHSTNLYHRFYSEISRDILKKNPDAKLYAYLYLDYRDLPTDPSIRYDDRVMGRYCAHGRCIAHPLADPSCEMNRKYYKEYLAWKKILKRASLGDYYFNSNVPYCPHEYVFAADMKICAANGDDAYGTHFTPFRTYTNWQYVYAIARMNWDPSIDIDWLMDDTYNRYYGPAAQPMKKYHTLRKELWKNAPGHAWYPGPNRGAYCLVLPESEKKLKACLAEAEKLVAGDRKIQDRIAIEKDNLENIWAKGAEAIRKQASEKRVVPAKRITGKIVIDGKIDEPEWKQAEVLNSFISAVTKNPLAEETNVRVLYDDSNWYVSIECMNDKGITPLKADCREHDGGVSLDDAVEFFIAEPNNGPYYHFIINSIGTLYDAKLTDKTFESKAEVKTSVNKDRYIIEVRIPVAPMGIEKIRDGQIWQAHFWRTIRNLLPPANMDRGGIDGVWPHRQNEFRRMVTGESVIKNGGFNSINPKTNFASNWGIIKRGSTPTAEVVKDDNGKTAAKLAEGGQIYQHFSLIKTGIPPVGSEISGEIIASGKGKLLFYIRTFIDGRDSNGKFKRTPVKRLPCRMEFDLTEKMQTFKFRFDLIPREQCYIYLRSDNALIYNVSASAQRKDIMEHK